MTWSVLPTLHARVCTSACTRGMRDGERETEQEILKAELNAACAHSQVLCCHLEIQLIINNVLAKSPSNTAIINWGKWCYALGEETNDLGVTFYKWIRQHWESLTLLFAWQQHLLRDRSLRGHWQQLKTFTVCLPASCKFSNCIPTVPEH